MERLELVKPDKYSECSICESTNVDLIRADIIGVYELIYVCQDCAQKMLGMFDSIKLCKTNSK